MGKMHEIYLTKKFISKEEWLELINIISDYNGILENGRLLLLMIEIKLDILLKLDVVYLQQ